MTALPTAEVATDPTADATPAQARIPAQGLAPGAARLLAELTAAASLAPPHPDRAAEVAAAREGFAALVHHLRGGAPAPEVGSVHDDTVRGVVDVPVRVYEPVAGEQAQDVVVFVHGGSWHAGGLDTYDHEARALALGTGARVVSVDYRLAPEHPYPAPFHDCFSVLHWVLQSGPRTVSVAGDSAGGNLAAALALAARDQHLPLAAQLLVYPATDPTLSGPSHRDLAEGYLLTTEAITLAWRDYVPDRDRRREAYAAPLAAGSLARVAPAVVLTAGFDPLRDDGSAYASRLAADGVEVVHLDSPDLLHAFWQMAPQVPEAAAAMAAGIAAFRALVARAAAPRTGSRHPVG